MNAWMKMADPSPYVNIMTDPQMMNAMMKMADPQIWSGMMYAMIRMMNTMPQAMSGFTWPAPAAPASTEKSQ